MAARTARTVARRSTEEARARSVRRACIPRRCAQRISMLNWPHGRPVRPCWERRTSRDS